MYPVTFINRMTRDTTMKTSWLLFTVGKLVELLLRCSISLCHESSSLMNQGINRDFLLAFLLDNQRENFIDRRKRIIEENLTSDMRIGIIKAHQKLKDMISVILFMGRTHTSTRTRRDWIIVFKLIPNTLNSSKILTHR
jgi:hypothetical protein